MGSTRERLRYRVAPVVPAILHGEPVRHRTAGDVRRVVRTLVSGDFESLEGEQSCSSTESPHIHCSLFVGKRNGNSPKSWIWCVHLKSRQILTTETRRTPDIRDRMTAARIGRWDRIDRISRMNSASASACRHPVDPVHPVKSSSSFGKVAKVIGELQCSVPPCLRGQYLPTFVTHTCGFEELLKQRGSSLTREP